MQASSSMLSNRPCMNGGRTKLQVAHTKLSHSRAFVVRASERGARLSRNDLSLCLFERRPGDEALALSAREPGAAPAAAKARRRHGRRFSAELSILHRPDARARTPTARPLGMRPHAVRKKFGNANVMSLFERVSRFTVFLRDNDPQSRSIIDGLLNALGPLPHAARRSITFDRGTEFTDWPTCSRAWRADLVLRPASAVAERHSREHQPPCAPMAVARHRSVVARGPPSERSLRPSQLDATQLPGLQNAVRSVPAEAGGVEPMIRLPCLR